MQLFTIFGRPLGRCKINFRKARIWKTLKMQSKGSVRQIGSSDNSANSTP